MPISLAWVTPLAMKSGVEFLDLAGVLELQAVGNRRQAEKDQFKCTLVIHFLRKLVLPLPILILNPGTE